MATADIRWSGAQILATIAFAPLDAMFSWFGNRSGKEVVVLAERYGVLDVLTLDHRHFNSMCEPGGRHFRLLPGP